jgi:hypothetical protein
MSRASTKTNYAKVKMWAADGCCLTLDGSSLGVMDIMFSAFTTAQQSKMLATLQAAHAKRLQQDNTRPAAEVAA